MGAQAVRLSNVDIDNALKNKDFEVLFQPIFDLGNGALARVESFIRWRHPSLGVLPPGAFISFFESQGRMGELTRYVLAQSLAQYREWRGASGPGFSINLALSDLTDEAFAPHFEVLLRDSHFPADLITLECPMPPVAMEVAQAAENFRRLGQTGARLAIEVRGRANDFLRTIEPFPFDEIKTGGAAILRFARTVRGPGLSAISELLEIAIGANAAITAVGVEDQASLSALRGLGFAAAQGNHLAKVGPLASFSAERVNEVRVLLGLEPLSEDDLAALFRTDAPAPKAADPDLAGAPVPVAAPPVEDDELVERLAARLARQQAAEASLPAAPAPRPEVSPARAAARAATLKAAAIAKAKRKAAAASAPPASAPTPAEDVLAPARSLQERLQRAFRRDGLEEIAEIDEEFSFGSLLDEEGGIAASLVEDAIPSRKNDITPETDAASSPAEEEASAAASLEEARAGAVDEAARAANAAVMTSEAVAEPRRAGVAFGGARAFFHPVMRVGVSRAAEAPAPQSPAAADEEVYIEGDVAPAVAAPTEAIAPQADEPAPAEAAVAAPDETSREPATRPRRRRKNLLTRKYRVWPTHFWPRSWKRAWRERAAERAARRAEQDQIAAE